MWRFSHRLAQGVLVILLLIASVTVSAAEYELDGEIVQRLFRQDGGVQSVQQVAFAVFVKDCSWLIQTIDHDESGNQFIKRETACVNGTEIYEVDGPANGARIHEAGTTRFGPGMWRPLFPIAFL